jgi:protein Tex
MAIVDDTGKFLEEAVIYPFQPRNDVSGAERTFKALIAKYNVRSLPSATGLHRAKLTGSCAHSCTRKISRAVFCMTANESGASICEPGGRRSQQRFLGPAPLRRRHQRTDRVENHRNPQ